MKPKFYLIITLLLIVGCSAKGPSFTKIEVPTEEKAVIYVYRTSKFLLTGTPSYTINNSSSFPLKYKGYERHSVSPGKVNLELKEEFDWILFLSWPKRTLEFNAKAGEVHFVRLDISMKHEWRKNIFFIDWNKYPEDIALRDLGSTNRMTYE